MPQNKKTARQGLGQNLSKTSTRPTSEEEATSIWSIEQARPTHHSLQSLSIVSTTQSVELTVGVFVTIQIKIYCCHPLSCNEDTAKHQAGNQASKSLEKLRANRETLSFTYTRVTLPNGHHTWMNSVFSGRQTKNTPGTWYDTFSL